MEGGLKTKIKWYTKSKFFTRLSGVIINVVLTLVVNIEGPLYKFQVSIDYRDTCMQHQLVAGPAPRADVNHRGWMARPSGRTPGGHQSWALSGLSTPQGGSHLSRASQVYHRRFQPETGSRIHRENSTSTQPAAGWHW